MANVIILIYGEGRHLVPKPASYESLLDVAHVKFPKLYDFDLNNIAFHVTPEWFDGEVELDRNAFAEVHNHAIVRITTTAFAPAQIAGNDDNIRAGGCAGPAPKNPPTHGMLKLCVIHVPTDRKLWIQINPQMSFRKFMVTASEKFGVSPDDYDFEYLDKILEDWDTPEGMAMEDLGVIEMHEVL